MADLAHEFMAALHSGLACLHPTDTLPGLTFDPTSPEGRAATLRMKGRDDGRPFLALVSSLAKARRYFAPLPGAWDEALADLWPGPLSVVWRASNKAPGSLVASDGTIGLRVPQLPVESAWFRAVLESFALPLPTTSVNRSGEPPARRFDEAAVRLALQTQTFVPRWAERLSGTDVWADADRGSGRPEGWQSGKPASACGDAPERRGTSRPGLPVASAELPSTIIRLEADGSFQVLRQGALPLGRLAAYARRTDG